MDLQHVRDGRRALHQTLLAGWRWVNVLTVRISHSPFRIRRQRRTNFDPIPQIAQTDILGGVGDGLAYLVDGEGSTGRSGADGFAGTGNG